MAKFLFLLILAGCATTEPLTEMEQLWADQKEQERKEAFLAWVEWCSNNGILLVENATSCILGRFDRGCIPHKIEWDVKEVTNSKGETTLRVRSHTYSCLEGAWW